MEPQSIESKTRIIKPHWGREKRVRYKLEHNFAVKDPQFLRCMGGMLGPGILSGNKIKALQNGDEIFPAMLKAIENSKKSISLETYIFEKGHIGQKFSRALSKKAKTGVKVHIIIDWKGSKGISSEDVKNMIAAGVELERYHPPRWYNLNHLNNRTHRKLLIVDGKIGFIGGVGIMDGWQGNADSEYHWRDSHYQVEGPVVAQMQAVFNDNWINTRSEVLLGDNYFPELKPFPNGILAQIIKSTNNTSENVRLMNLLAISSAIKSIRLQAAYFVPDELTIETLLAARKRGVDIEIIVPGPRLFVGKIIQRLSRSLWGVMLNAGIKIYEYQPTKYHCKVIIVDDLSMSVGSTNFDDRSFKLNDEANMNIYDGDFVAEQIKVFEKDKKNSTLITLKKFKHRPLLDKILGRLLRIFRSEM